MIDWHKVKGAAWAEALASSGVGPDKKFRLGAALFDSKGRVLSTAHNSYKTHPALTKFFEYPYLHAECAACIKYGLDNLRDLCIIVVRIDAYNMPTLAKPCQNCADFMRYHGIRKIYYTEKDGSIENILW